MSTITTEIPDPVLKSIQQIAKNEGVPVERLAAIARERDALKDELAKVIKAKKARAPIYAKLRALSIEELTVEGRR